MARRGRPPVEIPPTEEIVADLEGGAYKSLSHWCDAHNYILWTVSRKLIEKGDRERVAQAVNRSKQNVYKQRVARREEYPLVSPMRLDADDMYSEAEVEQKIEEATRHERLRSGKLARQNSKLEWMLKDRSWERDSLMELASEALCVEDHGFEPCDLPTPAEEFGVNGDDWYCHAPTADIHAGKYVWGEEAWGCNYDTDIAAQRIVDHGRAVADWILAQPGNCLGCYMTDLGDLFHALDNQTEGGTLLHQDTRAGLVFGKTLAAKREALEAVRETVPVVWGKSARGNHDHNWNMTFHSTLAGYYESVPGVEIEVPHTKWAWFRVGSPQAYSVHFLDHGKGINQSFTPSGREKLLTSLEESVPADVVSGAKAVYMYIGHLHHHAVLQQGKKEIIRLPSMAETDDYETDHRFAGRASAIIYRLDGVGCVDSTKRVYF